MRWLLPPDRLVERLARCVVGLTLFGTGVALIIASDLGAAPWDVFHTGVSDRTGIPVGTVIVLTGLALLVLWIPLRERIGIGTVLNATIVGIVVDVVLPALPETDRAAARVAMLAGGIVLVAVGSGFYIGSGLGSGPRDGLMTGLARRGWSIHVARTGIELSALVVGVLLGGAVGVGTAAFALTIGPLVHWCLPPLRISDRVVAPAAGAAQ